MAIEDTGAVVLTIVVEPASSHEANLVEQTLEERFTGKLPEKFIGDKA